MVWPKNGAAKQICLRLLLTLSEVQEANDCSEKQALWFKVMADKNVYTFWCLGVFKNLHILHCMA